MVFALRPLKTQLCSSSRQAIRLRRINHRNTLSILRIALKLHFVQNVEPNAEIGQKGAFCKGLYKSGTGPPLYSGTKTAGWLSVITNNRSKPLGYSLSVIYYLLIGKNKLLAVNLKKSFYSVSNNK